MDTSTIALALIFFAVSVVSHHFGKMSERESWHKLVEQGRIPKPGRHWRYL